MQVDSYLELFTTFYGWAFANIIGELITGTGLIVVPFIAAILITWKDAKERGMQNFGIMSVIESVQTKLIVMLFVMSLCFFTTPIASLTNAKLAFTPQKSALEPSPVVAQIPGTTDSTFDAALLDATDGTLSPSGNLSYVPLWWYAAMSISSGVNQGVRSGLKNTTADMRVAENMARDMTIEDPALLSKIQRFYSECFIPARSQFLRSDPTTRSATGNSVLDPTNKIYGPTDVDWMGSQFFRNEPGYYGVLRSRSPVNGFAVDLSRDTDYFDSSSGLDPSVVGAVNPQFGRPTCKEWWEGALRQELISHSSTVQSFAAVLGSVSTSLSPDKLKDEVARIASTTASPVFVDSEAIMGDDYDKMTTVTRAITGGISTLGVASTAFWDSVSMLPLMTGLPMIQALILMALYMFLPLIIFLSGFDLRIFFFGALAIFTVKLWASMWYIAQWVDSHLIDAMYPGNLSNVFIQEAVMVSKGKTPQGYKRMILNSLLMGMFIGFPLIWSTMMMWLGVNLSAGIAGLMQQSGSQMASAGKGGIRGGRR